MDFERITDNQLKIIFSDEELGNFGILSVESLWQNPYKWNELLEEMQEIIVQQLGIDSVGTIAVEIFSNENQGMVLILTIHELDDDVFLPDEFITPIHHPCDDYLFQFSDFEHIIHLSERLAKSNITGGGLYFFNDCYYLSFPKYELSSHYVPLVLEYGNYSMLTVPYLLEYGKCIIKKQALENVFSYFSA